MISSKTSKNFSQLILVIAFIVFIYATFKAIEIVNRTQVSTSDGIYTSYVTTSKEIEEKAYTLSHKCKSDTCKVQSLLTYVTNIPYRTNTFQKKSPQKTIQENFGDCDDKSNLLISMLHSLKIQAYFVLVPKHIFVIVPLENRYLADKKGIWINNQKYYILESTVKDSSIGFPLHYDLDEIEAIIEPFSNEKIAIERIKYKL